MNRSKIKLFLPDTSSIHYINNRAKMFVKINDKDNRFYQIKGNFKALETIEDLFLYAISTENSLKGLPIENVLTHPLNDILLD